MPRSLGPAKISPSGTESLGRWQLFWVALAGNTSGHRNVADSTSNDASKSARPKVRALRALLEVSLPLESATFGRPEVAPAGAPQKSCQRLRDWVPEGLILAGARLRGTARCERFPENATWYSYTSMFAHVWEALPSDSYHVVVVLLCRLIFV